LHNKIAITVGLICGWMYSDHALQAFMRYQGINEKWIDTTYRGEDQVGLLKISTDSGLYRFRRTNFHTFNELLNYRACFSSALNRLRCRVCEDHVNVLADVAVGDAWLKRNPGEKLSLVIVRNKLGLERISKLISSERIKVTPGTVSDLFESQSKNLVCGSVAIKLNNFLANSGVIVPTFTYSRHSASSGFTDKTRYRVTRFIFEKVLRTMIRQQRYQIYRILYLCLNIKTLARQYVGIQLNKMRRTST